LARAQGMAVDIPADQYGWIRQDANGLTFAGRVVDPAGRECKIQ
jgi:hypothetical protein